jgi:hypothetical protein
VDQLLDFDPAGASLPAVADPVPRSSGSTGKAKLKGKSKVSDPKPAALVSAAEPTRSAKRAKRAKGAAAESATYDLLVAMLHNVVNSTSCQLFASTHASSRCCQQGSRRQWGW